MNVDRGLRPLENWVCGAVERGGRPGGGKSQGVCFAKPYGVSLFLGSGRV